MGLNRAGGTLVSPISGYPLSRFCTLLQSVPFMIREVPSLIASNGALDVAPSALQRRLDGVLNTIVGTLARFDGSRVTVTS